jgi:YVTN family beta-propeller protein
MSVVYLAHHDRLDRKVALKLLDPELAESEAFRKRFIRESKIAAGLDHPNVIPVHDAGEADGVLYIAMRYVSGSDLKEVIRRGGPLDPGDVVRVIDQMAAALDAAHAQGLVHRDVKPGNALLPTPTPPARVGHLYLADFGLTRKSLSGTGITRSGQFVGTIDYVAPEQIRSEPVDGRADVYSLACVLYECLVGEPPFVRDNEVAVMFAHINDPPPAPTERRTHLPAEIDAVVAKGMAKQAGDRYGSAGELAEATHAALLPVLPSDARTRPPMGRPVSPQRRRRRRTFAGVAVALAAIIAIVAAVVSSGGSPGTTGGSPGTSGSSAVVESRIESNSVGMVDAATGKVMHAIQVGASPSHIAVGEGAIWVTNTDGHSVSRIDPESHAVQAIPNVGSSPSGITTAGGFVWVTNSLDGTVAKIDPSTNTVTQTIPVGNGPLGIVAGGGSIWVANTGDATITRIDPKTGAADAPLPIPATELAFRDGTLWATDEAENRVVRIDPSKGSVTSSIEVGEDPTAIAIGDGAVWVTNILGGDVSKIDPITNKAVDLIPTGNGPNSIAVGPDGVWVTNQQDGTLKRIDPSSDDVTRTIHIGNRPQGVATFGSSVLVGVRESDAGHQGGTLTVAMNRDFDAFDPAVGYDSTSWALLRMTNDGLVAFNQESGLAGTQLVPDLAVSLPDPSPDGMTYTFHLRPEIHYSDGTPVKASDVRATFERDFELGTPVPEYYTGIVGADACLQAPRCSLQRGIETDDATGTVIFHLTAPDSEFLDKLALPFAYIVPSNSPRRVVDSMHPLPATGPYEIAGSAQPHEIRLERNPHFEEWSKASQPAAYPDAIVFDIGGSSDQAVRDVLSGKASIFDSSLSLNPPSESVLRDVEASHASQIHTNQLPATIALFLNTTLPPFNDPDVRRALNYAADRAAAVHVAGGSDVAQPTCQILPPHFPGYRPYCPYATIPELGQQWPAPNLNEARKLIQASGTRDLPITVWSWGDQRAFGPFAKQLLESVGYHHVEVKQIDGFKYFGIVGDSGTHAQIGTAEWISDYPTASGFFVPILTCDSILLNNPSNSNNSFFCDRRIDGLIQRALAAQATNPDAARGLWERVDQMTVDRAPWVPLVNTKAVDVLAKNVGNYQFTPPLGVLLDQLWVH